MGWGRELWEDSEDLCEGSCTYSSHTRARACSLSQTMHALPLRSPNPCPSSSCSCSALQLHCGMVAHFHLAPRTLLSVRGAHARRVLAELCDRHGSSTRRSAASGPHTGARDGVRRGATLLPGAARGRQLGLVRGGWTCWATWPGVLPAGGWRSQRRGEGPCAQARAPGQAPPPQRYRGS